MSSNGKSRPQVLPVRGLRELGPVVPIARPYTIRNGKRVRTSERRDYSVMPPRNTLLDNLIETDRQVFAIGKIHDIFNGKGLTQSVHTEDNTDGINKTIEAIKTDFDGLIFTNLVDFDTKYGHRRDPSGYGKAINAFDSRLPDIMHAMKKSDVLMLCAPDKKDLQNGDAGESGKDSNATDKGKDDKSDKGKDDKKDDKTKDDKTVTL